MNKVILIGRLGRDPEHRVFPSGEGGVTTFSLATDRKVKNANGQYESATDWHNIVVFNKLADVAQQYLHKGKQVSIEGNIRYRKYTDNNGIERTIAEIICESLTMIGSKSDNDDSNAPSQQTQKKTVQEQARAYQASKDGSYQDCPF